MRHKAEPTFSSDGTLHDDEGNTISRVPKGAKPEPKPTPVVTVDEYEAELEYNSATPDVLAWAQANTSASRIEVIGPEPPVVGWVWLTYPGKPDADERTMLKANKFRWHSKRKQWYHRCGTYSKTRGKHQPESIYARMTVTGEDD